LTFFEENPRIDVAFGDFLVADREGDLLCYRKVPVPGKYHLMVSHLPTFTCAIFFRRKLIDDYGLFFDTKWRGVGDGEWMSRLLERTIPMATLGQFTSTFAEIGSNMSLAPNARREKEIIFSSAPLWMRQISFAFVLQHRLRRLFGGAYSPRPFSYCIYTQNSPLQRGCDSVNKPTFVWKNRP
jgi:hypothetical protein